MSFKALFIYDQGVSCPNVSTDINLNKVQSCRFSVFYDRILNFSLLLLLNILLTSLSDFLVCLTDLTDFLLLFYSLIYLVVSQTKLVIIMNIYFN